MICVKMSHVRKIDVSKIDGKETIEELKARDDMIMNEIESLNTIIEFILARRAEIIKRLQMNGRRIKEIEKNTPWH